jgi:hypothetical protein
MTNNVNSILAILQLSRGLCGHHCQAAARIILSLYIETHFHLGIITLKALRVKFRLMAGPGRLIKPARFAISFCYQALCTRRPTTRMIKSRMPLGGHAHEDERAEIRDQKRPAAVGGGFSRETEEVAQADAGRPAIAFRFAHGFHDRFFQTGREINNRSSVR